MWCLRRRTKKAQAQKLDFDRRNKEIQARKEENERQLEMNDKALSDAALGVRTRDRQIINLGDKVRRRGIMYAAADVFLRRTRWPAGTHGRCAKEPVSSGLVFLGSWETRPRTQTTPQACDHVLLASKG